MHCTVACLQFVGIIASFMSFEAAHTLDLFCISQWSSANRPNCTV